MICPKCLTPARPSSVFCTECGARLEGSCPHCGIDNPESARFCRGCGVSLGAPAVVPRSPAAYTPRYLTEKILTSRAALEGQHKQVTVLFVDVKGSQQLARRVDAELWHEILDRYFEILTAGVHRFEGTINQYTGDGVMALFGAPLAHEDHAQRACAAALALRDELATLSAELRRAHGLDFATRMGLNSGEVVVGRIGDDLRMDYTAQGHTVGLAARMEALAQPGTVYLTKNTARLVQGFFDLKDLGRFSVKGEPHSLRVYELRGIGPHRTRFEVARERGLSPFVGREAEMSFLEERLAHALSGEGHAVGIVSEAGIGKSRLLWEFAERCRARGVVVLAAVGLPQARSMPLVPIVDLLRSYFGLREDEDPEVVRERVAGKILLLDERLRDSLPRLFEVLRSADPQRLPPRIDPEARRRELVQTLIELFHVRSAREPLLVIAEDLQGWDAASQKVLEGVLAEIAGNRILVLLSVRSSDAAILRQISGVLERQLEPLAPAAAQILAERLLGDHPSVRNLISQIAERSEGHAFFIEEMIQSLVASRVLRGEPGEYRAVAPVAELSLPATVQALLDARIDALPERERVVLQAAAVLGREVSPVVLEQVVDLPPSETEAALDALCDAGLLTCHNEPAGPGRTLGQAFLGFFGRWAGLGGDTRRLYAFRHALLQEVAYSSQLAQHRSRLHAEVARALERLDPERREERAALIAHHRERAGEPLAAAGWYARAASFEGAGDAAEAFRFWQKVRALCREISETPESLTLLVRAGVQAMNLSWRLGMPEAEVREIFIETRRSAERSGRADAIAGAAGAFGIVRGMAGNVREALSYIEEATRLAESSGRVALEVALLAALGYLRAATGDLRGALAAAEHGIAVSGGDVDLGAELAFLRPVVFLTALRGFVLTYLGRLAEAGRALSEALAIAERDREAEVAGWINGWTVLHATVSGDGGPALERVQRGLEVAERSGSPFSQVVALASLGRIHALRSQWPEAVATLSRSLELARLRRTGLETEAGILADLAAASLEVGEAEQALRLAAEAVEIARKRGLELDECVASRVHARILLETSRGARRRSARRALDRSLELARDTGARALEPAIHLGFAELARANGDAAMRSEALGQALALYREIGAEVHAERLAAEVAADTAAEVPLEGSRALDATADQRGRNTRKY